MANVRDDDVETLEFADESEYGEDFNDEVLDLDDDGEEGRLPDSFGGQKP